MTLGNALQHYQDIRRLADIDTVPCLHCRRLMQTDGDTVCEECCEDTEEEELLPCPFCGEQAYVTGTRDEYDPDTYLVVCINCCCEGPRRESIEEAKAAWNTRKAPAVADDKPCFVYSCAACGVPGVAVPLEATDGMHSGCTLTCPECGGRTVLELSAPDQYCDRVNLAAQLESVKNIWLEFVEGGTGGPYCGLCANTGWFDRTERGVVQPCICPNGRAIKAQQRESEV